MSFRDDVSINWTSSPRVVEVNAPSTQITVQDLLDTLRTLSASSAAIGYDEIVDASGKEVLSEELSVGLTLALRDAVLKFADRGVGQWVVCNVSGGNLIALTTQGNPMSPIAPAAYVSVTLAQSSSATLLESTGESLLTATVLFPDYSQKTVKEVLEEVWATTAGDTSVEGLAQAFQWPGGTSGLSYDLDNSDKPTSRTKHTP